MTRRSPAPFRRCAVIGVLLTGTLVALPARASAPTPGGTSTISPKFASSAATDPPASTTASVLIDPGGMEHGFSTPTVSMARGGVLTVTNRDSVTHTVTSEGETAGHDALFDTVAQPGTSTVVAGASRLAPGRYPFYCSYHPNMRGTLVITGTGGGFHPVAQSFDQPLTFPRVLTAAHIRLAMARTSQQVMPTGPKTVLWTYGGSYPGPTIRRPSGARTAVTFSDDLPATDGAFSVHLHGDHHTSASDGQPTGRSVGSGASRVYNYPLRDHGQPIPPAFGFYHDHEMGATGRNNWNGMQGMMIVDDGREQALKLPTGGYDLPLLVADRRFDARNRLVRVAATAPAMTGTAMTGPTAPPNDATVGNRVLVNGRYAPYLNVSTHRYRIRLLNASNYRSYDFALSSGQSFTQIGTGSSLLPKPVVRQDILLGPAQRADVIVDFNGEYGRRIVLASVPRRDGSSTGTGTPAVSIMQFRVTRRVSDATLAVPVLERTPAIHVPSAVSATWDFGLGGDSTSGTYWAINGLPFDPRRVDLTVPLGSTQSWLLHNSSSITHYVHIHEEQWHTVSRDGRPPPAYELGLQDTWRLDPGESVVVAATFTDYTGVFMIHCHMLDHEDHGMMAQFRVAPA